MRQRKNIPGRGNSTWRSGKYEIILAYSRLWKKIITAALSWAKTEAVGDKGRLGGHLGGCPSSPIGLLAANTFVWINLLHLSVEGNPKKTKNTRNFYPKNTVLSRGSGYQKEDRITYHLASKTGITLSARWGAVDLLYLSGLNQRGRTTRRDVYTSIWKDFL